MAVNKRMGYNYVNDKCNPPPDMGVSTVFADALPGLNNMANRPFGWTEYEAAYRHQYIPAPPKQRICKDLCRPQGVDRKPPPTQFFNVGRYPRSNICQLCMSAKCKCPPIPPPWEECKEKVMVYDPDSVRTLLVHGEVKNDHPFVISNKDYFRIMNNAIVKDKDTKERECAEALRLKMIRIQTCRERADEMRLIDKYRFNDSISPEAREDMNEVLCRSEQILKGDIPEVKTIESVILAAKVQAIREAQLLERDVIRCERAEEDRRLDALMKQDAEHALIKDDDKEWEKIEQKKKDLMASLQAQLDENEAMKFYMKEMKEREGDCLTKLWEQYDMEDIQKNMTIKEKKHALGLELLEDQMKAVERMRQEKEIDKALDQMMIDFHKIKDAEDEKLEAEKRMAKKMKEMQVKAVLDTQKRTSDAKALRDEMRARRHQEMQERAWRKKEREEAEKRRQGMEDLKEALLEQLRKKREWLTEQASHDKGVYDGIYTVQQAKFEEEKKKEDDRKCRNAMYRYDLREQIHDWQLRKIQERKDYYVEGLQCRKAWEARDRELRCYMERKVEALRESNMPEKYLRYIERAVEEELKPEFQKKVMR